ncbi:terminase gpA endonuclease subunit [Pseudoxanthomonas sp. SE1]|uniref:phage terminase large subunit family protein n=1 Tax=Pseudoxanthomonas sp. SE1 TaxID=1664560 RepID=UPI00240E0A09|nr:terminase gpA endonuclease subunit [Pseudoxanthomonas sp. SE1]WFC43242.1 phage terminase large subunit family protein [Pseudoxanthomonas sp. SE1]
MSILRGIDPSQLEAVERHLQKGLEAWSVKEPLTLEQWARDNFYLSAESSYVEQSWTPWPFQRAVLAVMSNDDVVAVDLKKSARIGYTKMLLASVGYNAEHRRRNQCVWQPTDDDAEDFVKSELDPMLRDVEAMRAVFPSYLARHKDNTLQQKKFIGSMVRVRGGKASKNYRRISIDVGYLDELDAFDNDIEKEGAPDSLAFKRLEGATFPKFICGSTPKLKGFSLIDTRFTLADERFTFQIPCPQCGVRHALSWGGKDEPHGFKFERDDAGNVLTVFHMCPHCTFPLAQSGYLAAAEAGEYVNERGDTWLRADGKFTTPAGESLPAPRHIALHVWTAYSPAVSWQQIVNEFLAAYAKQLEGDDTKMKAWVNTTLGNAWEGEVERTDAEELKQRAEPFPLKHMPRDCLLLLCAIDTQDNRLELAVWGYGRGGRMWTIDHRVFFGNPAQQDIWMEVEEFLRTQEYSHASGRPQRIYATAIDSGGHHADAVYAFAHRLKALRVHAVKGASGRERSIENGNSRVSYRWNGKIEKLGPVLWHVGTNLAKDRFQSRLEVAAPGPGYVHLSADLSAEWFKQLAGEIRATRRMAHGTETRWTPTRKRIEVKDCLTYTIWLEERLDLWAPRKNRWWDELEVQVQPEDDLFSYSMDSRETPPVSKPATTRMAPPQIPEPLASAPTRVDSRETPRKEDDFGSGRWSSRL